MWPRNNEDAESESESAAAEANQSRVVDDRGFPVTKAGFEMFAKTLDEEQRKRDPDAQGVYISNDGGSG